MLPIALMAQDVFVVLVMWTCDTIQRYKYIYIRGELKTNSTVVLHWTSGLKTVIVSKLEKKSYNI